MRRDGDGIAVTRFNKVSARLTLPPASARRGLFVFLLTLHPDLGGCRRMLRDRYGTARNAVHGGSFNSILVRTFAGTSVAGLLRPSLALFPRLVMLLRSELLRVAWPLRHRCF